MGPLQALTKTYYDRLDITRALPQLGLPSAIRHGFRKSELPDPDLLELNSKTKEPNVLCVEAVHEDGVIGIVPLLSPCSYSRGSKLTKELVRLGVHPLDIKIATLDLATIDVRQARQDVEPGWTFRDSVDWMFWTHEDQKKLELEAEDDDT